MSGGAKGSGGSGSGGAGAGGAGAAASRDPSFEDSLAEVEGAIRALEAGDIPLEDSIDLYARAMQSLKRCHVVLDRAEGRLEIVRRSVEGGAVEAVPAELKDGEGVQPAPPRPRAGRDAPPQP